jgi:hypothetical protein
MAFSLKQLIKLIAGFILLVVLIIVAGNIFSHKANKYVMGGFLHNQSKIEQDYAKPASSIIPSNQDNERFLRPSKQPALKLKYIYSHNENFESQSPVNQKIFNCPEDVIQAYFAFLEQAENMNGYCGGCGTIGYAKEPFPHAYELLTRETKQKISLDEFITSFLGIGHTTLLKLIPAYAPPDTPKNIKYYIVEFEIITAPKCNEIDGNKPQPTYFAYYYGLITTEQTPSEGWKIKAMDYIPEDFLCAPYHMWYWDSTAVVQIIFGGWYKLIDEIEKVDIQGSNIKIYAKGKQNRYRFDALRLTNGEDIFLHEYIWENDKWKEVDYIVEKQKNLKFSILQFRGSKK